MIQTFSICLHFFFFADAPIQSLMSPVVDDPLTCDQIENGDITELINEIDDEDDSWLK